MYKDVNFPLLIKICYDSKQSLRKIYSKCITTFSTYPFSPSSITRRSWNWTPREKNALTKPQLSHRGENLKTSFFSNCLCISGWEGVTKTYRSWFLSSYHDGISRSKKKYVSEFCSRRHRAPKISKRMQFSQIIVWDLNQIFQDLFSLRLLGRYFIKPPILLKFTLIFHF